MEEQVLDERELEGLDLPGLGSLSKGEALRPLRYDRTQYVEFEEFLLHLHDLPGRKKRVPKSALSVNGRVVADSMEAYLSHAGESSSALKQALITPRHYVTYKDPRINRDKKHFQLGTFCHSAFLQPELFRKVRTEPKADRSTINGVRTLIEWYWEQLCVPAECPLTDMNHRELKELLADCERRFREAGYVSIPEDDNVKIDLIRKVYTTYGGGILPRLMKLTDAETSFYGTDPLTGLKEKVRPDAMLLEENIGLNIVVSFKTTSANTIEQFARDCVKYKYDLSEGMYIDVMSRITGRCFSGTLMVVLQTCEPWQVFVLWWSPDDLEAGKYKYRQAMEIVAECKEKRSFPGYDARAESGAHGIIQFELPEYSRLAMPEQNID